MNKKKQELSVENAIEAHEKKTWINPELSDWNIENIENSPGIGLDGGTRTYIID